MAYPKNIEPSIAMCLMLPQSVRDKLDELLKGPDGKIPRGGYQRYFVEKILHDFYMMRGNQ